MLLVLDIKLHFSSSDIQIWLLPSSRLPADPQHFARNYGTICQGQQLSEETESQSEATGSFLGVGKRTTRCNLHIHITHFVILEPQK